MRLYSRIAKRSVTELTRVACLLALAGLVLMVYPVIVPQPLPVILSMTVGHIVCAAAFGCYALAVVVDAARRDRAGVAKSDTPPRAVDEPNE